MQQDSELLLRLVKPIFYRRVDRPEKSVIRDISYVAGGSPRQSLDLYLPDSDVVDWPIAVFIHGGGWTDGDRNLEVAGEDVYGNVGRFLASKGIGCAVISYRLMPGVHWLEQFRDAACAVAWTQSNVEGYGGDAGRTIIMGHSAGAHLGARVALDRALFLSEGGTPDFIRGVVSACGAGFDMIDEETYRLGADIEYLRSRFGSFETPRDWQLAASVVQFVDDRSPPFLLMYGSLEEPGYGRQANVLAAALRQVGVRADVLAVTGQTHRRMVPALSRDGGFVARKVLSFVTEVAARAEEPVGRSTGAEGCRRTADADG